MRRLLPGIALFLLAHLSACATQPPRWRNEAILSLERARKGGADAFFPAEFSSAAQSFQIGEAYLKADVPEDAENYYYLALLKSELLEQETSAERQRRKAEALRAEEQQRWQQERSEAEARERAAQREAERQKEAEDEAARKKAKPQKEHPQLSSYTVRRGESLPLIASRPEVYGDRNLWPLIYRANRDQIRDPRHLWPGQVLRLPRNITREDVAEAKRYAQDRPLR